jgi:hypothetical protein
VIQTRAADSSSKCSRRGESTPARGHLRIGQFREIVSGHNLSGGELELWGFTSYGLTLRLESGGRNDIVRNGSRCC